MDAEFWLARWREGRTHFHQERVEPLLQKYWPALRLPAGSRVLVPLCGKSHDMAWLAGQGLQVLGAELSPLAVEQFFREQGLSPEVRDSVAGPLYCAGSVEILCGDIFGLDAATLAACRGVYDRAALVALPRPMRERYAREIYGRLAPDYRGLLIALDYPQQEMDGPPFSVGEAEVRSLYAGHSRAERIDRRDILAKEPKFQRAGVSRLHADVYRLEGARGG